MCRLFVASPSYQRCLSGALWAEAKLLGLKTIVACRTVIRLAVSLVNLYTSGSAASVYVAKITAIIRCGQPRLPWFTSRRAFFSAYKDREHCALS